MALLPIPPPTQEPIAKPRDANIPRGQQDPGEGIATDTWIRWFVAISQAVSSSPTRLVAPIALVTQGASIGTTAIVPSLLAAGLYRVSWYARITQAATVNSSLTVTIRWTDNGTSQTFSGAAIVGNTTTTIQTQEIMVYMDGLLPVTYETAYVSVGATPMLYELFVSIFAEAT